MKSVGDLTIDATRYHVLSNITNERNNGFSQLYFHNISGTSQDKVAKIYNGQPAGVNITVTAGHLIRFSTNRFAAGTINSLLQAAGTRKVVVNVPLVYKPYASLLVQSLGGYVFVAHFGYCSLKVRVLHV